MYFSSQSHNNNGSHTVSGDRASLFLKEWIDRYFGITPAGNRDKCYKELIHCAMMSELMSNGSIFSDAMFPETLLLDLNRLQILRERVCFYAKAFCLIMRMGVHNDKDKKDLLDSIVAVVKD